MIERLNALTRWENKKRLNGEKADTVVGSLVKQIDIEKKVECCRCDREIYVMPQIISSNSDLINPEYEFICPYCVIIEGNIDDDVVDMMINNIRIYQNVKQ